MDARILPNRNVAHLDSLLINEQGFLAVHPAEVFLKIPSDDLRLWAHHHAVYQFPTAELVAWLRERIAGRSAIEIGAGHGAVGRALGIPLTDSFIQTSPETQVYFAGTGQPPVRPAEDVKRYEANDAARVFKPRVVIGCWITQKWREQDGPGTGSMYGVNEERLLERVEEYIHVGNAKIHGVKRIRERIHETFWFPWLVSRATYPEENVIYVWNNKK